MPVCECITIEEPHTNRQVSAIFGFVNRTLCRHLQIDEEIKRTPKIFRFLDFEFFFMQIKSKLKTKNLVRTEIVFNYHVESEQKCYIYYYRILWTKMTELFLSVARYNKIIVSEWVNGDYKQFYEETINCKHTVWVNSDSEQYPVFVYIIHSYSLVFKGRSDWLENVLIVWVFTQLPFSVFCEIKMNVKK